MNPMRLSIGVPAYNQGGFLRKTLESILRQEVAFDEIVVSNNHSTDDTAAVIASVMSEHPGRLRVVTPPTHLTMAGNWNFTISQLTGDWVSLLSSDDLAMPIFSRVMRAGAERSPDAVLVRAAWKNIGAAGELLEVRHLLSVAALTRPPKTLYEQRYGPKGSFAAFALRRDVWQKVGGFPEDVTLVGDWGMWLLAGALGDIVYMDDVVAAYRVGHQSDVIRRRHHIHMREMLTIYDTILPRATESGGFGRPAWIADASRRNFRRTISETSRSFAAHERQQLIDAFRPWAEATGELAMMQRFERGEVLATRWQTSWPARLRPLARRVVASLRSIA